MLTIEELQPGNIVDYMGYPAIIYEKQDDSVTLKGLGQFGLNPDKTLLENIGPFFPTKSDFVNMGFDHIQYGHNDYSYKHKITGHSVDIMVAGKPQNKPLHEIQNEIFSKYQRQLPTQEIFRTRPAIKKS